MGHHPDDPISVGSRGPDGIYTEKIIPMADADAEHQRCVTSQRDMWVGVNTPGHPIGSNSRGNQDSIARLNALFADLDYATAAKPGGFKDTLTAEGAIAELSNRIGQFPEAVISSGHGLQPYWTLERSDTDELPNTKAKALLKAWGVLVAVVADDLQPGVTVDNVYDLTRVGRAPITVNWKNPDHPVITYATAWGGAPLGVQEAIDRLAELGIDVADYEHPTATAEPISPPEEWLWNECSDCRWTPAMIAGWARDTPGKRHPWMLSKKIKIEAARRYGCFPDKQAYLDAQHALDRRFADLRTPGRYELQSAQRFAIDLVSRKTDEQIQAELNSHRHADDNEGEPTVDSPASATATRPRNSDTGPRLFHTSELKPSQQPKWLAKNRIPQAAVTILIGEEGIGKSLLWVLVVAAVTTGKPMEEFGIPQREPGDVILILTEDEWSSAVRPRLEVANADLDRIHVICTQDDGTGSPTFPDDMHIILNADPTPALVVCDAWLDTVPGNLQIRDAQQSRQALHPWKEAAGATGAPMLLLAHTNRLGTANIRDKYGASASLRQKARMTLYCLPGPDDTFIVGPDKSNGASGRTKASKFRIEGIPRFEPTPDHDGVIPAMQFLGNSDKTIKEHLAETVEAERTKTRAPAAAELWLRGLLEGGDRKLATVIYNLGKTLGFSVDQIKRSKRNINNGSTVRIAVKKDPTDERWYWNMEQQTADRDDEQ